MLDRASYVVENLLEFGLEDLTKLGSALDAGAESALAKVLHDDGGRGAADVRCEEARLELIKGGLIDLAGERDDGADGVGERLAGARDRLPHAVEEAEFRLFGRRFPATRVLLDVCRREKRRPCWV